MVFHVVKGEPARYGSSPVVFRSFCGPCGTSLVYQNTKHGNSIDITTASLDVPAELPPTGIVFAGQKPSWDACPNLPVVHDLKPGKKQW